MSLLVNIEKRLKETRRCLSILFWLSACE